MNSESVPNLCPRCCGAVPADAPQGLCPRCVLARAATPTEAGARSGARLTPPPLAAVAAAFPQFEILELIGVGGMGVVYKARQPKLDRIVALKLLPQSPSADPAFAERFHREARFLARLTHPYIVSVFDFGESGGFCFLLMEYVDGVNLRQAMQAGRFSPAQALAIVPDICAALQYAHNQGVLHRDIKPENILLDAQGRVKIADFGIAKLVGDPGDPRTDLALTQSGARLGTPHYMAPEQIEQPADVDHRADIYSLGVVFYELLTGELPLGRFAAPSAKTPLDARVDEIVMRALAKERELRQQSAGEMKTQVETVAANPHAPATDPTASAIQASLDAQAAARSAAASWPSNYEYRSPRTLFGRPLVHVAFGRDPVTDQALVARGIIAIGQKAVGVVAMGGYARGLLAFGGVAIGGVAFGGLGLGVFAVAGLALGLVSVGGLSIGLLLALGGGALGLYAGGGLAVGKVAAGGLAIGRLVWDARRHDEAARWILALLQGPQFPIAITSFSIAAGVIPTVIAGWVQWHRIRRGGIQQTGGAHQVPIYTPMLNPWPHRLKWLLIALFALPFSAYVASLVSPLLHQGVLGGLGGLTAGLVPMTTGAALVWLFMRTRPSGSIAGGPNKPSRRAWLGWGLFFAALFTAIMPVLLYQMQRQSPSPPTLSTTKLYEAQLIRTERFATNSGIRFRWELHSAKPAVIRLGCQNMARYIELPEVGPSRYGTTVTVLMGAESTNEAFLVVAPGKGITAQTIHLSLKGNPEELVAKANEFVTGDLPLKFNTPIWLAFFGSEQITLELRPPGSAPVSSAPDTAPPAFIKGDARIAALELQFAHTRLDEVRKQVEVGAVAPQGREILDAEVAVAEAEAKVMGNPRIAAEARLKRAILLRSAAQRMHAAGNVATAEVEQAQLEEAKARADLEALEGRKTPDLKDGEWWPASAGPENLTRAFALGARGDDTGALAALRIALEEAAGAPTNRWIFRRGYSAYVFDGQLDQRITALMAHEATHSIATLREIQTAGTLIWPADGELDLYEVWVDHFVPGRADQDTDRVRAPVWLLRSLQSNHEHPVTVIREHKELGKPAISNIVTGNWLEPR